VYSGVAAPLRSPPFFYCHFFVYTNSMNSIHQTIKNNIVDAMRAKDSLKLDVLRGLSALFTQDLINKGSNEQYTDDETALTLIRRSVKQRNDSIEQFTKGNRPDLAEKEKAELEILNTFLPAQMSDDEITAFITAKIKENPVDKAKIGVFIGSLMKDLKGKADGGKVRSIAEKLI